MRIMKTEIKGLHDDDEAGRSGRARCGRRRRNADPVSAEQTYLDQLAL